MRVGIISRTILESFWFFCVWFLNMQSEWVVQGVGFASDRLHPVWSVQTLVMFACVSVFIIVNFVPVVNTTPAGYYQVSTLVLVQFCILLHQDHNSFETIRK